MNHPQHQPRPEPAPASTDTGLIVGIAAIDYYPQSCVVWGFAFNDNTHVVDLMNPDVKVRDAENLLCQRSQFQGGGSDWSIHGGNALFFWPAFTYPGNGQIGGVPGYGSQGTATRLSTVTVQFAGFPTCTLPAQPGATNLGEFTNLPHPTKTRILKELRRMTGFRWWEAPSGNV